MARTKRKKQKQLQIAVTALVVAIVLLLVGIGVSLHLWLKGEGKVFPPIEMPVGSNIAANEYDEEAYYREGGFLRYEAPHMVGIDVSVFQGEIDWKAVADSGVDFVIIRAGRRGSSEGLLYEDEMFQENLKGAKKAGLKVGAYFFSQARNWDEAEEEGRFALEILDGAELDLPVFFDWEVVEGSDRFGNLSDVPMTECAAAFCERVRQGGYEAGVYFNQSFGYHYLDLGKLQDYTLWLAEYNEIPTFDYHFHLVQYSDKGNIPGIDTTVDLNLWILE